MAQPTYLSVIQSFLPNSIFYQVLVHTFLQISNEYMLPHDFPAEQRYSVCPKKYGGTFFWKLLMAGGRWILRGCSTWVINDQTMAYSVIPSFLRNSICYLHLLEILKDYILPHDFLVEQGHSASPKNVWRELFLKAFHGRCWTNLGELFYMENSWSDYAKDGGVSQMHFPVT